MLRLPSNSTANAPQCDLQIIWRRKTAGGSIMRKILFTTSFVLLVAFGGISAAAQCNPATESFIKCGYYNEGYQDGIADAQSSRRNDYRRFSDKYERKYENNYSQGYNAGYDSIRGTSRWTNSQRTAYDSGYNLGESDRRRGGENRSAERTSAQYDQSIGLYFQQGYFDAFYNRPKQYDVALGNNNPPNYPPTYPPNNGGNATATWNGRVDDRANIIIRGNTIRVEDVSGNGVQTTYQNINGSLPRRATTVTAHRTGGRGDVTVIQQPDRSNDFTAIVQVSDPRSGADNYKVDITWSGRFNNVEEPYSTGNVSWRGRVDQTANIIISGADVQTEDAAGTGLSSVSFNINGSLARRPGSITARKRNGRGTVTVLQQPSRDNDYTAIVQVFDPGGGADNYEVDITW